MTILKYLMIAVVSYLAGAFSFSIFLSNHLPKGDVRRHGSGNAGATNMARTYGWKFAIITLAGDMLKCVLVTVVSKMIAGNAGLAISGVCCLTGHCFPVWYHFKGGKGVSVGGALCFVIDWRIGLTVIVVFLITALLTRKVSVGSCAGVIAALIAVFILKLAPCIIVMVFYCSAVIIFQHTENLIRVASGTEPDFHAAEDPAKKK